MERSNRYIIKSDKTIKIYGVIPSDIEHFHNLVIDKNNFEIHVSKMLNSIRDGWKVPPLILNYENGNFTLNDSNHRYEALLRHGIENIGRLFGLHQKLILIILLQNIYKT